MTEATHLSRLRWRCRRGMRELDALLSAYLEHKYPGATVAEQRAFESLLELEDPELLAYLMRRARPANPEVAHVVAQLSATLA